MEFIRSYMYEKNDIFDEQRDNDGFMLNKLYFANFSS